MWLVLTSLPLRPKRPNGPCKETSGVGSLAWVDGCWVKMLTAPDLANGQSHAPNSTLHSTIVPQHLALLVFCRLENFLMISQAKGLGVIAWADD